jgi:glycosyl hydrolase family 26
VPKLPLLAVSALAVAVAAATVAAPAGTTTTTATATTCGKLLPPSWGSYLGAFAALDTREMYGKAQAAGGRISAFEELSRHRLAWVSISQEWDRGLQFPRERVLSIWRHGAVPYIAFLPTGGVYRPGPRRHMPEHRYTLQRIIAGVFDGQLRAWADDARALGVPLLLAFGAEVNDGWGPWNARWNGASQTDGYGDPAYPDGAERYRDAFRHLVTVFRDEGARNVAFAFHVDAVPAESAWNGIEAYYPGDAYVDWLGISVYGALGPRVGMTQFARKLDESSAYTTLTKLSRRPIAIVQLGTVERGTGEKAAWIRSALRTLRSGRYARVRAVVWWSMDGAASTRIDSTPEALTAFRAGVQGTSFAARLRFAGDCRPPPPDLVVATPVRTGVIRVHWSPVEVASAYEVWRDGRRVVTTKATTWLDRNARPGPSHSYHVRAVGPGGRSV